MTNKVEFWKEKSAALAAATGVAFDGEVKVVRSDVKFRELSEEDISWYVSTGEPMDKAGAYGAQGLGAIFIKGITGDFFNVMGLPLCRLAESLEELGTPLTSLVSEG